MKKTRSKKSRDTVPLMVVFARKSDEYSIVLLLSKLKMTDPDPQKIIMDSGQVFSNLIFMVLT